MDMQVAHKLIVAIETNQLADVVFRAGTKEGHCTCSSEGN